ncbi:MAG: Smr/MutS family protein [Rickettsiales bacterium]
MPGDLNDAALWGLATTDATPFSPNRTKAFPAACSPSPAGAYRANGSEFFDAPLPSAPRLPDSGNMARKRMAALRRGKKAPDAVLDLHGMDRRAAFGTFFRFAARKRAEGARTVLVITGKSDGNGGEGALKSELPFWAAHPDLRCHISGYRPASPNYGGEGAFFVFLKKQSR